MLGCHVDSQSSANQNNFLVRQLKVPTSLKMNFTETNLDDKPSNSEVTMHMKKKSVFSNELMKIELPP